jgi:hypothetical protein
MQPEGIPLGSTPSAPQAQATMQAVAENAQRLGLTWQMRLATVVAPGTFPTAIYDGDTVPISMTSMIGAVYAGQRVWVIQVPPSGNYIVGSTTGQVYRARQTLAAAASTVVFSGIPRDLRFLSARYRARGTLAAILLTMGLRFNGNATANYYAQQAQAINATPAATALVTQTYAAIGVITGALADAGSFGHGSVQVYDWDKAISNTLGYTYQSVALGTSAATFQANSGGGALSAADQWTSLTFLVPGGGSLDAGSDFQLEGIYT